MIDPVVMLDELRKQGFRYFAGVPDSLLKDFCQCITDNIDERHHVIAPNEGNAIGLGTGWFLGTGEPALIYMQNSGIGNAINPLMSLADPEVYSIPMLLVVGWRGMPNHKDEPQHVKQGRIMPELLEALEVPFEVLGEDECSLKKTISDACDCMRKHNRPVVILVRPGTFSKYNVGTTSTDHYSTTREQAIRRVVESLAENDVIISTTGKASRELYECGDLDTNITGRCFLTVGSMGHASSIAMGLATAQPDRRVICLDGDGAVIMHMGAMAIIGKMGPGNLVHIVLNNGTHESVGGQPTVGFDISLTDISRACGYKRTMTVSKTDDISSALGSIAGSEGPVFIEIRVSKGARENLGRPKSSPIQNRDSFMTNLNVKIRR